VSFLLVTVPVSLLVAGSLLAFVIYAVRSGAFDDWDGPAERHVLDDDRVPESRGGSIAPDARAPAGRGPSAPGPSAGARVEGGAEQIRLGDDSDEARLAGAGVQDRETASVDLDQEARGVREGGLGGHVGRRALHHPGDRRLAQPASGGSFAVGRQRRGEERAVGEAADEHPSGADGEVAHPRHAHQSLRLGEGILGGQSDEAPAHRLADPLQLSLHVHGRRGSS